MGAHKYLLELSDEVRRPVCTTPGPDERLIGNIRLKIYNDSSICKIIVKDYDPGLGIRSLRKAVRDRVTSLLDSEYMTMPESISEGLPVEDYCCFVMNERINVKRIVTRKRSA